MKKSTNIEVRVRFTDEEREVLRRATYADGAADAAVEARGATRRTFEQARSKALMGKTANGSGNAYRRSELGTLAAAVAHAIEHGVPTEEEFDDEPWAETARALEDAADSLEQDASMMTSGDLRFNKEYHFDE